MRIGSLFLVVVLGCSGAETLREPERKLDFEALAAVYPNATQEESFVARDGTELPFRYYDGAASVGLILLHGSAAHSIYLSEMAATSSDAYNLYIH